MSLRPRGRSRHRFPARGNVRTSPSPMSSIHLILTSSAYERHLKPVPKPVISGSRIYRRFAELVGITGVQMSKYRCSWREAIFLPFNILWRPQGLTILFYEAVLFGFSVGMHVTNVVFLGEPKPFGYGLGQFAIAGVYGTPIVSSFINSFTLSALSKRNDTDPLV
jgi:hypothetical protein